MKNRTNRAYVTYVTQRDEVDKEHAGLCLKLRQVLRDHGEASMFERNLLRLRKFCDSLSKHHQIEDIFLLAVSPSHRKAHADDHERLQRLATEMLDQARDTLAIDHTAVRNLLTLLENHILKMDKDLADAVNRAPTKEKLHCNL